MERWMISSDFTILQAPPSDGNVSVHATKAAKSVVGFSHRFTICESKFGSLRLKSLDVLGTLQRAWFNLFNASSHLSPSDSARCSL